MAGDPSPKKPGAGPSIAAENIAAENIARNKNASQVFPRRSALKSIAAVATAATLSRTARADLQLSSTPDMLARRKTGPSIHKQRAVDDYRSNMRGFGGQLATPIEGLLNRRHTGSAWQFDVLIIGSGYGASITAARLAPKMKPGSRLAMLERGREWVPGTFGDTLKEVTAESRYHLFKNKREVQNPTGLFNVQQYNDVTILSGSGLGGSSLINASVALRPDRDVFWQSCWPTELRDRDFLDPYYDRAEWELGVQREPIDHTFKMRAQRLAAERLASCGAHFEAAAISITRGDPRNCLPILNRQGIFQRACTDCGDCLTGCNVGAKNTLASNYLPLARRAGAEMYTQTEVKCIEKHAGGYRIHYVYHGQDPSGQPVAIQGCTTARIVVLGAGSIGSTEILMRSSSDSLSLSNRIGHSWTGNGDALGFVRRSDYATNIGGFSAFDPEGKRIGPTIETNLTYPNRPNLKHRILIQEGTAARSYANALSVLMRDFDLDQTQILLGMGHDGANGRIELSEDGNATVQWPGILESEYRTLIRAEFAKVAQGLGGKYKFLRVFGDRMISVHPLGGCAISDSPDCGVINHKGQVFDAAGGGDIDPNTQSPRIHEGLYVSDGSVFPTSIGCNPYLTISAMAERNAELLTLEPKYADLFEMV
jgi:cholesterol oxidase